MLNLALTENVHGQIRMQAPLVLTCSSFTGQWANWEGTIFQTSLPQGNVVFLDSGLPLFELDRNKICGFPQLLWLDQDSFRSAEGLLDS